MAVPMRWGRLWRPLRWLLQRLWLLVPMGLAVYSLTQPWARARIALFWGITRSPGALVLVLVSSLSMLVAGVAVAGRRRSLGLAGCVHFASGALMALVAWRAYRMVEAAGVKAFGFIPLASVRPGSGLHAFSFGALVVVAVGAGELAIVLTQRRRTRRQRPAHPIAAPQDAGAPALTDAESSLGTDVRA